MSGKANWKKIETEYITGNISAKKLAEKYNIPIATVSEKRTKGKWSKKRKEYKEKVISETVDKIAESTAEKLKKEYDVACRMGEVLEKALVDEQQFYRHIDVHGNEDIFKTLDTKRLSDAAKALKDLTEIKKLAGNLITEFEDRKLRLEERKVAVSEHKNPQGDDDDGCGVVMMPAVAEGDDE